MKKRRFYYWKAWSELSNIWHRDELKPILTVSPTLIFESPATSTTNGSPSFSKYKKVPEPSFSTTNTFPSQLASPSWFTRRCSGLIPSFTFPPWDTDEEVLDILILEEPNRSTSVIFLDL